MILQTGSRATKSPVLAMTVVYEFSLMEDFGRLPVMSSVVD